MFQSQRQEDIPLPAPLWCCWPLNGLPKISGLGHFEHYVVLLRYWGIEPSTICMLAKSSTTELHHLSWDPGPFRTYYPAFK